MQARRTDEPESVLQCRPLTDAKTSRSRPISAPSYCTPKATRNGGLRQSNASIRADQELTSCGTKDLNGNMTPMSSLFLGNWTSPYLYTGRRLISCLFLRLFVAEDEFGLDDRLVVFCARLEHLQQGLRNGRDGRTCL